MRMTALSVAPQMQSGVSATRYAACLRPENPRERFCAPVAMEGRLPPARESIEPIATQGNYATRLAAPMNLEIVADPSQRAQGFSCESRRAWVGHCDVPPSQMRAVPPAESVGYDGCVSIWVIEKGHLVLEQQDAAHTRFGPGSIMLWDAAQPPRGRWDHARFGYVRLGPPSHRHVAHQAVRSGVRAAQRLDHLGLAPFLSAQIHAFSSHATTLTAADLGEVVGGIVQVAHALLKVVFPMEVESPSPDAKRLEAVHHYIEHNLHRTDLSVADIARGTHMSRAQLYRLFATQETSVHGTLREKRLQRSLGCLAQGESKRQSIGAIGHACGFSDPAVFSKLFRQRFNLAPRDVRAAAGLEK